MLETFLVIGIVGLGASFLVSTDPVPVDEDTDPGATWGETDASLFLDMNDAEAEPEAFAEDLMPAEGPVQAGDVRDNFDPARDVLTIVPPEGFLGEDIDISMVYDFEFHETEITVTGDEESFALAVSGVMPEDFAPESLAIAA